MANWVYNRPPVKCADSELEAARFMAKLDDGWWIRWGYYYKGDREGDFLVLGPAGGLLVLEIKSQLPHNIKGTGNWVFGDESADNPLAQLNAEWAGVIEDLKQAARGRQCPYVVKAIGLPNLNIAPDIAEYHGIKRQFILDQQQIAHLGAEWPSFFKAPMPPLTQDQRQVFLDAYCRESGPSSVRAFVDETDELILRHTQAEYELLDMLSGNRQLLVEGGPGSGAEFAFAKIHGIYPNFHEGGPIKFDFVIDGMRVDVKSTKYTSGNLLLPLKLTLANSAEAFALVRGTISDGFDYAGWLTAEEYFAKAEKRDLGWGLTWFLDASKLRQELVKKPNL